MEIFIETVLPYIISVVEIIGIIVVTITALTSFGKYLCNLLLHKNYATQFDLANGMATGLEFKMAAEILKTVLVRDISDFLILGAVIVLRALLSLLIYFELKHSTPKGEETAVPATESK